MAGSQHHARLDRKRWGLLRLQIFRRDGWRCRSCGKAGALECDHVTPLRRGGEPYDPMNLQTLCRACHIVKTARENERHDPARDAWRQLVAEMFSLENQPVS